MIGNDTPTRPNQIPLPTTSPEFQDVDLKVTTVRPTRARCSCRPGPGNPARSTVASAIEGPSIPTATPFSAGFPSGFLLYREAFVQPRCLSSDHHVVSP